MDLVENSVSSIIGHNVAWTYQLPVECSMFVQQRAAVFIVNIADKPSSSLYKSRPQSSQKMPLPEFAAVSVLCPVAFKLVGTTRHQHYKAGRTVSDHHRRSQVAPWLIAQELESVQKIATMNTSNRIHFFAVKVSA